MKDYSILEKWIDDYNGAAIYSLVDENGKRYRGQAIHLQQRLNTHRQELNKAYKRNTIEVVENVELANAARRGIKFKVDVLYKIPWYNATKNNLLYYENYYLEKYGGYKNTYNKAYIPMPRWDYEKDNNIKIRIDIEEDLIKYLETIDNANEFIKDLLRKHIKKNP